MFSEKYSFSPAKIAQIASMDAELQIGLWNVFEAKFFAKAQGDHRMLSAATRLFKAMWTDHFKNQLHTFPGHTYDAMWRAARDIY